VFRRIWVHRHLLFSLVKRQFHLRYRQSLAGFAWALVPPLATLAAATLIFHEVIGVDTKGPYALFALSALAPWTFFANSLILGVPSIMNSHMMVTRLSFPRAIIPLSTVGISLLDLGVAGLTFVAFSYAVGEGLPVTALWFPFLVFIEIVLIVGVLFLASALNVFARDVGLAVPLVVQVWFFLTPVVYPLDNAPAALRIANPMTGLVESFRQVLVYGHTPDFGLLFPAVLGATAFLVIGFSYFRAVEANLADVI
jgi:lipopolysaccharide transport system permease protein